MRVLALILGRWPLYLSQGPAAEMVSVVHFPVTLYRTRNPLRSWSGNGAKGSRSARRSDVGDTTTSVSGLGAAEVGRNASLPSAKPLVGSSAPWGGEKRKLSPDGVVMLSVRGLNVVLPAYDMAVTISGDARKFIVSGFPSLRPRKL